jgi:hypothetical protein
MMGQHFGISNKHYPDFGFVTGLSYPREMNVHAVRHVMVVSRTTIQLYSYTAFLLVKDRILLGATHRLRQLWELKLKGISVPSTSNYQTLVPPSLKFILQQGLLRFVPPVRRKAIY